MIWFRYLNKFSTAFRFKLLNKLNGCLSNYIFESTFYFYAFILDFKGEISFCSRLVRANPLGHSLLVSWKTNICTSNSNINSRKYNMTPFIQKAAQGNSVKGITNRIINKLFEIWEFLCMTDIQPDISFLFLWIKMAFLVIFLILLYL